MRLCVLRLFRYRNPALGTPVRRDALPTMLMRPLERYAVGRAHVYPARCPRRSPAASRVTL